jgi:hypothetical protein
MKTLTKKQWEIVQIERKAAQIKEECPEKNIFNDILPFLFQMQRYEKQLQRLAEIECNGFPKEVTEQRDGKFYRYNVEDAELRAKCEKKELKLIKAVTEYAAAFNLTVEFQGDPRGMMFSLKTKNGREVSL